MAGYGRARLPSRQLRHGHPDPRTSAAASQARVASEKAREAAQKAEQERIDTQYEHCFSPWNGSHKLLVDLVKAKINTPRSFKHVKTTASYTTAHYTRGIGARSMLRLRFSRMQGLT